MRTSSVFLSCLFLIGCGGENVETPVSPAMKGMASINFDDGFESAFVNGMPIVDAAGLKTTQFIITQKLDVAPHISVAQMLAMQANGHEIAAHTRTHPHLSTLTDAQQHDEIDGSLQDLRVNWGIEAAVFAYPYGDYNDSTLAIVRADGFNGARTTSQGFDNSNSQALLLKCFIIDDHDNNDINRITQAIDDAQANGTWLILLFHRVDEPGNPISISHEIIEQTVNHLVEKKTPVVTMSEGLARYGLKP
jgi:peptidoglycan/xylan/chitin deacetylase (PgdA/CDA1 family)